MRRIVCIFLASFGATLALGTPAMSIGNQGSVSASAGIRVVITEKGRGIFGTVTGTFTLRGAAADSGRSGLGGYDSSPPRFLDGQRVQPSKGTGVFAGKKGDLSLTWSGPSVDLNASADVTTGTWRIKRGTGIYKTWKGGGRFVIFERHTGPNGVIYEARWEGLVTR